METRMLDRVELSVAQTPTTIGRQRPVVVTSDWRARLPMLHGAGVILRELRRSDAPVLLAMLSTEEVTRFVSPPPTDLAGFERFIAWSARERAEGRSFSFGIVPKGQDAAVGFIQVRSIEAGFGTGEWGFAIGSPFWGLGIFQESAKIVVDFVIGTVGVHRLEARAAVANGRGNGALRKLGAVEECLLRKSFRKNAEYTDQVLWSIVAHDWRQAQKRTLQTKTVWGQHVH